MYGYGGLDSWYRVCVDTDCDSFTVDFQNKTPAVEMSFHSAANYNARVIGDRYKNICVALSGGMDSEFVAHTLYQNGIDFTPFIGIIPDNQDHRHALDWCEQRGLTPEIFNFKSHTREILKVYMEFLKSVPYTTLGNPIDLFLNSIAKQHGGVLLTGSPTLPLTYEIPVNSQPYFEVELSEFALELTGESPGCFFFYTPEIVLAQAKELDQTLKDEEARAKLYGVAVRWKTPNIKIFDKKIHNNMYHIMKDLKTVKIQPQQWYKEELIKKLTNNLYLPK